MKSHIDMLFVDTFDIKKSNLKILNRIYGSGIYKNNPEDEITAISPVLFKRLSGAVERSSRKYIKEASEATRKGSNFPLDFSIRIRVLPEEKIFEIMEIENPVLENEISGGCSKVWTDSSGKINRCEIFINEKGLFAIIYGLVLFMISDFSNAGVTQNEINTNLRSSGLSWFSCNIASVIIHEWCHIMCYAVNGNPSEDHDNEFYEILRILYGDNLESVYFLAEDIEKEIGKSFVVEIEKFLPAI